MNPNINNSQLDPAESGNCKKNRRSHDADEKLLRFGVIKTEDNGFLKLCKKASTNSSQDKTLQASNSFDKLGKSSYFHFDIFSLFHICCRTQLLITKVYIFI